MSSVSVVSLNVNGLGGAVNKKRRKLFNYLHCQKIKIALLQETHSCQENEKFWLAEWGSSIFFSHGTTAARGVAILIHKSLNGKIEHVIRDTNGRMLGISIEILDRSYLFVSIYAPNVDDVKNFKDIFYDIYQIPVDLKVLTGDFNTVLNINKDLKGGKGCSNSKTRLFLNEFIEENELIDIWRLLHPNEFRATFEKRKPIILKERIDYILVSEALQQNVISADIVNTTISDHAAVTIEIKFTAFKPGKGYWKLNNSLLEDQLCVSGMVKAIESVFNHFDRSEICIAWDIIKMKVRQVALKRGVQIAKSDKMKIKVLECKLNHIMREQDELDQFGSIFDDHDRQILAIKTELDELLQKHTAGAVVRCRANWMEYAEKPSKYFFSLEKHNYNKKTITCIQDPMSGHTTTNPGDILNILSNFYADLYSGRDLDLDPDYLALLNIPQVKSGDSYMLDGPIQLEEIHLALKQMKKGKCPGVDGLSVEFYLKFWGIPGKHMHALFLRNVCNGSLHNSARDGIISLLNKPDKDHLKVKNWRPLSLLNNDYKIYAKVLANRLDHVLPYLISDEQVGFMKGRSIADNLSDLLSTIKTCEENNIEAMIWAVDMHKAFDVLNHIALKQILQAYGMVQIL